MVEAEYFHIFCLVEAEFFFFFFFDFMGIEQRVKVPDTWGKIQYCLLKLCFRKKMLSKVNKHQFPGIIIQYYGE